MLHDADRRQKLGIAGLSVAGLVACGFVGASFLNRPANLEVKQGLAATDAGAEVVVHVTGAVESPGLVRLTGRERVDDAIKKAGGATKDANLDGINLAARVVDGMQIVVATKGEEQASSTVSVPTGSSATQLIEQTSAPGGLISINSASAAQLEEIPGIGPVTAKKIIEYRQTHGGFKSIDELMQVKGIGPKKLENMRPYVKL